MERPVSPAATPRPAPTQPNKTVIHRRKMDRGGSGLKPGSATRVIQLPRPSRRSQPSRTVRVCSCDALLDIHIGIREKFVALDHGLLRCGRDFFKFTGQEADDLDGGRAVEERQDAIDGVQPFVAGGCARPAGCGPSVTSMDAAAAARCRLRWSLRWRWAVGASAATANHSAAPPPARSGAPTTLTTSDGKRTTIHLDQSAGVRPVRADPRN